MCKPLRDRPPASHARMPWCGAHPGGQPGGATAARGPAIHCLPTCWGELVVDARALHIIPALKAVRQRAQGTTMTLAGAGEAL